MDEMKQSKIDKLSQVKICLQCAKKFNRPLDGKGYPVYESRWKEMRFCGRKCAYEYRSPYLRRKPYDDAEETRTLRSGCGEARPHKVIRLCDMHSGHEAKAQAETKALGSLLRVKAPELQFERDLLFDKYMRAYDNLEAWSKGKPAYTTNYSHKHGSINMGNILRRHLDELSTQLRRYDDRINAATTTGPLYY